MHRVKTAFVVSIAFILTLLLVTSVIPTQSAVVNGSGSPEANVAACSTSLSGIVSSPSFGRLYSTSINVSPGYLNYVYVGTGGGDHPINTTTFNVLDTNNNGCSPNGSIIGYSHYNTASIETGDYDYSISGIGVNLPLASFKTYSNDSNGSHSLAGNFTLATRSLVLLASAGTNEGYPSIQGSLGNVSSCTPWGDLGILFSYAILSPGSYNFSINYELWGNVTDYASSIGAVLFEFNESATIYRYVSTPSFGPLYSDSVYLPTGYLSYIYVATGGGDHPMQNPSFNVSLSDSNYCSSNASIIGYSHSNVGKMQTGDYDYSISGIGVNLPISGFRTYRNDRNGSHELSGNFSLSSKSLVLLASAGTNQGYPVVQGALANTSTQNPWGDLGASFSYSLLGPGQYNFSINYQLWGNSTDYAASTGAVIYEFNDSSNVYQVTFTESGLPLTSYMWYLNLGYANYTSSTDTIIASLLAGQYSYSTGVIPYNSGSENSTYASSASRGDFVVPSSKTNFTLVYSNTTTEHNVSTGLQPQSILGFSWTSYAILGTIAALAVAAVIADSYRKKRT
jgi:hypothetical protein